MRANEREEGRPKGYDVLLFTWQVSGNLFHYNYFPQLDILVWLRRRRRCRQRQSRRRRRQRSRHVELDAIFAI